jgi:DNA-binding MarR family transcriptional regulator
LIEQLVVALQHAGYRDIRVAHSRVFEHLPAKGARVARMAEAAQMTQQSMTELVEYLELRGYVERLPDPRDRRAKLVRLTKTGERLSATGRETMRQIDESWEALLGKDRMREMQSALSEVLEFYGRPRDRKARKPNLRRKTSRHADQLRPVIRGAPTGAPPQS